MVDLGSCPWREAFWELRDARLGGGGEVFQYMTSNYALQAGWNSILIPAASIETRDGIMERCW